eukprot:1947616-Pleurochrysis_carterae.AAC.1
MKQRKLRATLRTKEKNGSHMRRVRAIDYGYLSVNFVLAMASLPSYTSSETRMPQSPQHNVCSSRPMG